MSLESVQDVPDVGLKSVHGTPDVDMESVQDALDAGLESIQDTPDAGLENVQDASLSYLLTVSHVDSWGPLDLCSALAFSCIPCRPFIHISKIKGKCLQGRSFLSKVHQGNSPQLAWGESSISSLTVTQ